MPKYMPRVPVLDSNSNSNLSDRSESPPPPYSEEPPSFHPRVGERTPLLGSVKDIKPKWRPSWSFDWSRRYTLTRQYIRARTPPAWRVRQSLKAPFQSRVARRTYRICERLPYNTYKSCQRLSRSQRIYRCLGTLMTLCAFCGFFVVLLFLYNLIRVVLTPPPPPTYSIAIIGAGPAGISAAQHLYVSAASRKKLRLAITLFEASPFIGGQLALNDSTGHQVFPHDDNTQDPIVAEDIAGPALLWSNPLTTRTSEEILGDQVMFSELPSQQVSYFTGDHVVAQTTRPYNQFSFGAWLGMLFHYGPSAWAAAKIFEDGEGLRDRLVDAPLLSDIAQLLSSLSLLEYAQQAARDTLDGWGVGGAFVPEVLAPQIRSASLQGLSDVSELTMRLAAAQENTANTHIGGELLDRLEMVAAATGATIRTDTKVSSVKRKMVDDSKSAWFVEYKNAGFSGSQDEPFDKVIIAAPNFDLYRGASAEDVEIASVLAYRPAHVTFFTMPSRLDPGIYGDVNQVLFLEEQNGGHSLDGARELTFVREIIRTLDNGNRVIEYLYRALSDDDVTEQLRKLDLRITWMYQTRLENAYPYLFPFRQFPRFKLSPKGLWWTSAIHAAAGTVDMSSLAGKIVAKEVMKDITGWAWAKEN